MPDMKNGNNVYKIVIGVIIFVVGVLGISITIYSTFHVPLANAVAKEKDERIKEDTCIRKEFMGCVTRQQETNSQMLVKLTEIQSDLKYLKRREHE